jgi:hypothetical protein
LASQTLVLGITRAANDPSLRCAFDAAAGTGTVPVALLLDLAAGNSQLLASVVSVSAADAGANQVDLLAEVAFWLGGATLD